MHLNPHHYRVHGRYSGKLRLIRVRSPRLTHSNEACRFKSARARRTAEESRFNPNCPLAVAKSEANM